MRSILLWLPGVPIPVAGYITGRLRTRWTDAGGFSSWAFASLLIGAFMASLAATIGPRARDLGPRGDHRRGD